MDGKIVLDTLGASLKLAMPEVVLAIGALVLLMYGVFRTDKALKSVCVASIALLVIAAFVVFTRGSILARVAVALEDICNGQMG